MRTIHPKFSSYFLYDPETSKLELESFTFVDRYYEEDSHINRKKHCTFEKKVWIMERKDSVC